MLALTPIGLACLITSWHPTLRVQALNPDTGSTIESFHPTLGFRGDKRWV